MQADEGFVSSVWGCLGKKVGNLWKKTLIRTSNAFSCFETPTYWLAQLLTLNFFEELGSSLLKEALSL